MDYFRSSYANLISIFLVLIVFYNKIIIHYVSELISVMGKYGLVFTG